MFFQDIIIESTQIAKMLLINVINMYPMNRIFALILSVAMAWFAGPGGFASALAAGPVTVRSSINPSETLRAGHELEFTIVVTFPDSVQVDEVVWPARWGSWDVVESSTSDQLTSNPGETSRTIRVLLRPVELGRLRMPAVPIFYSTDSKTGKPEAEKPSGTARQFVETKLLTVEVESPVKPEDLSLKSLESNNSLLSPRRHWSFWVVLVLAATVIAGLIWSAWRAHRKKKAAPLVETPQEWATRELEKLLASNLAQTNVKEFYINLTDIIRTFIERTTLINAPELTTEEFLRRISLGNVFSDVERLKLKSFLEQADMVKFARYEPQEDLVRQSVYSAEVFIGIEKQDF